MTLRDSVSLASMCFSAPVLRTISFFRSIATAYESGANNVGLGRKRQSWTAKHG